MLRILIADGTPAVMQAVRETFGIPSNALLFEAALSSQQPGIECSSINIADGQDLPGGVSLGDFDGLMFSGSPLHIYDETPEVTRQIDFARAAFTAGLPVWASCWGLQLATVALGGTVRRNPRGRELGVARAITATAARSIPVVVRAVGFDPLAKGYIAGLAHPGGNLTGVMFQQPELIAKRLDLLTQAVSHVARIVLLYDVNGEDQREAATRAASALRVPLEAIDLHADIGRERHRDIAHLEHVRVQVDRHALREHLTQFRARQAQHQP